MREIIKHFNLEGELLSIDAYGNGHINDTYLIKMHKPGMEKKYIFQRLNTDVFQHPKELMENIMGVTAFLAEKIRERGGDPHREALHVIPTKDGQSYYQDKDGGFYRVFDFVENCVNYDMVKKPEDFYEVAVAFGNFQFLLAEYPAKTLHETIPDFHNTGKRYETFLRAVREDVCHRTKEVQPEIAFVMEREKEMTVLTDMQRNGELPLRVTHNDTKLNNIMMDAETGKAVCVIDLDTVMPGLSLYDFGDSIRFGANTAAEDEPDVSKVSLDLNLYEMYVKGYLKGCNGSLTANEIQMLPMGAKIMTLECGLRFLTDYLMGDVYFKVHKKDHNLLRCRTQFALVADMEKKWLQMAAICKN